MMGKINCSEDDRLYLQMMQDNIARMATNSANAKTWLVTIVAALLAIAFNIADLGSWVLLAVIPILVFWNIDAYYLNIERGLRNREQRFINILKNIELCDEDDSTIKTKEDAIFVFKTLSKNAEVKKLGYVKTGCMLFNKSVWPTYVFMFVIIVFITIITNGWLFSCNC